MKTLLLLLLLSAYRMGTAVEVDCAEQAAAGMELNLSAGVYTERAQVSVPLKLRIPTGTNPHSYAECLKIHGADPSREMVQAIAEQQDCRRQAGTTRLATATAEHGARIGSAVDAERYRACLESDIDVELLGPDDDAAGP